MIEVRKIGIAGKETAAKNWISYDMDDELSIEVISSLRSVMDPELAMDLVSLGLIYGICVDRSDSIIEINIDMTLTTVGCPVSESLPEMARDAVVQGLISYGVKDRFDVNVNLVWDPPWTPERIECCD